MIRFNGSLFESLNLYSQVGVERRVGNFENMLAEAGISVYAWLGAYYLSNKSVEQVMHPFLRSREVYEGHVAERLEVILATLPLKSDLRYCATLAREVIKRNPGAFKRTCTKAVQPYVMSESLEMLREHKERGCLSDMSVMDGVYLRPTVQVRPKTNFESLLLSRGVSVYAWMATRFSDPMDIVKFAGERVFDVLRGEKVASRMFGELHETQPYIMTLIPITGAASEVHAEGLRGAKMRKIMLDKVEYLLEGVKEGSSAIANVRVIYEG